MRVKGKPGPEEENRSGPKATGPLHAREVSEITPVATAPSGAVRNLRPRGGEPPRGLDNSDGEGPMARRLTCPRGHQWDAPSGLGPEAASQTVVCPVCGTAVDPLSGTCPAPDELPPRPNLLPRQPHRDWPTLPGYEIL